MTRTPWVFAALAVVTVLAFARDVGAQQSDKAEAYYVQAVQLFDAGRYQEALDNFNEAIKLRKDAIFFCNRAAVELKLREPRQALGSLKQCRDLYESTETADLMEIDAEIQGLEVFVDGVDRSSRSIATSIANGLYGPNEGGATDELGLVTVGAWSTAGVAALSFSAALAVELMTQGAIDDFEQVAARGKDRDRYDELRTTIDDRKVLLAGLVTVGAVSLVTSGLLFWLGPGPDDEPAPAAAVVPLPGGALVQWGISFR